MIFRQGDVHKYYVQGCGLCNPRLRLCVQVSFSIFIGFGSCPSFPKLKLAFFFFSEMPVILSLEDHCNRFPQKRPHTTKYVRKGSYGHYRYGRRGGYVAFGIFSSLSHQSAIYIKRFLDMKDIWQPECSSWRWQPTSMKFLGRCCWRWNYHIIPSSYLLFVFQIFWISLIFCLDFTHFWYFEGLFAFKPNEERSCNAVSKPAEAKDSSEAQKTKSWCGKSRDGAFSQGNDDSNHHIMMIVIRARLKWTTQLKIQMQPHPRRSPMNQLVKC